MRKWILIAILLLTGLITYYIVINYPVSSDPRPLARLSDTMAIRTDLEAIIGHHAKRNYAHPEVLDSVASYIHGQFSRFSSDVSYQPYTVEGRSYRNVIASFGPKAARRIIVGAHYDVCGKQDGADDNASGVAGLLALARILRTDSLKDRIDLVAYTLEEPPYFRTPLMGSYVHAQSLDREKVKVRGMISLEMIGYFSDAPDSQEYPVGALSWVYGRKGDYITIVKQTGGGDFAFDLKRAYFTHNTLPAKAFAAPGFFGGIDLSDHRNYWSFGYSAVMLTNTAFYRNHEYHLEGDTLGRLDIGRLGLVVDGLQRALMAMQ